MRALCYNTNVPQKRPVGQAVKTSASHAENMGSIPVPVTRKKIGTPQGVPIFFVVHGTTSNPAHTWHKLTIVLCVILFLSLVFRFVRVRLGSHTAIGGILRRAALFVIIDIRGTPFTYSSRAADSRTCLPLGVMSAVDVPPDLSYGSHLLAGQYTAYAVCTNKHTESTTFVVLAVYGRV